MSYNPLLQLNHQKADVLESLRAEIDFWLRKPNHSQVMLATRAGMSPQMLNDVIQHRRGCSPDLYEKIIKALRSSGNRFVNAQQFGRPVPDLELDAPTMEEFANEHTETNLNKMTEDILNLNVGTTFEGKL